MKSRPKIGVFDSGVGGITVLKSLLEQVPGADYIYLGDSARLPYGPKGAETVTRYSFECAEFLLTHAIDLLVVACNTASTAALPVLKEKLPIPVLGMIEPASQDAIRMLDRKVVDDPRHKSIAIIGTEGTIHSRAYEVFIQEVRPDTTVYSQACPLFVPVIEQGIFSGPIVDELLRMYLSEIQTIQPTSLILGCTHYPLLKEEIQKFLGNETALIACGDSVAGQLAHRYEHALQGIPSVIFYTTDSVERFNQIGSRILSPLSIIVEAQKITL